jgi:hypothetical protein
MNQYLKQYWGVAFWVLLGVLTLLPAAASKPNLIGYYSLCTFAPVSTLILWAIAGLTYRGIWAKTKQATA